MRVSRGEGVVNIDLFRLRNETLSKAVDRRELLKRAAAIGVATPLMASLLAACGGDGDDSLPAATEASGSGGGTPAAQGTSTAATSGSTGEKKSGGKLSMSLADQDATSFDPIIPTDNMSIWTMVLFYSQVVRNGPDGASVEPDIAEKWELSQDGLTYTFHLRDMKFHDGTAVTAADCKYCIDRVATDELSQWSWIFTCLNTVTATDDKTLTVLLNSTWAPFLADLSLYGASIYPKAAHEEKQAALFDNPVGSGPFKWVSWDKEVQIVLTKNPDYWEEGMPYLDELTFKVLPDANQRMLQFQSGELDIATDVPFSQLDTLRSDPNVQLNTEAVARLDYIAINHLRFPDVKVRQAINYAVDKQAIIDNVLFGAGEMANTILPKMLYWNPDVKGYPYDLDQAKSLIAETDLKGGFKMELLVGTGRPDDAQVAQLVADNLKDIGGDITVTQLEAATKGQRGRDHDYDLSKSYYTTDIVDPDELIVFGTVSNSGVESLRTSYKNEQIDALALQAETETDPEKRKQMYYEIQQINSDDAMVIYLYYPSGRTVLKKHIQDFHILATGNYRLWETWRDDV